MMKVRYYIFLILYVCLLFCFGCKTTAENGESEYDIRGTWEFYYEGTPNTSIVSFTGSITQGTFRTDRGTTGTYTVNGTDMSMSGARTYIDSYQKWEYNWETTGTFIDTDHMSGSTTVTERYYEYNVFYFEDTYIQNWTATKI